MAEQLTGKSIQELTQAPIINDFTNIIVQREGSLKAEKTQLNKIVEYINNNQVINENIYHCYDFLLVL